MTLSGARPLKDQAESWRAERACLEAADGALHELCDASAAMARGSLMLAEYYRHHRGEWRKRGGKSKKQASKALQKRETSDIFAPSPTCRSWREGGADGIKAAHESGTGGLGNSREPCDQGRERAGEC